MATFTGKQIKNTYQGIVQIDEGVLKDAVDNPLTASIGGLSIDNDLIVTGSTTLAGSTTLVDGSVTGSLNHSGSATIEGTYQIKEGAYGAFFANPQTLDRDLTIPASYNSRIFGPITIAAGKTLTVSLNAKLSIIDI